MFSRARPVLRSEKIRAFVALPLPDDLKDRIAVCLDRLRIHDTSIRWLRSEQMHVTLRFLGAVTAEQLEEIFSALSAMASTITPFSLGVSGLGQFPPRGVGRVLWAGLTGDLDALGRLVLATEDVCERTGFPRGARPFRPHVTLARPKSRPRSALMHALQEAATTNFGDFTADRISVYKSETRSTGPHYTILREFLFL